MDLTGLGSVADFAGGILDRFWPPKMNEADKIKAQAGIADAMAKREVTRDALKSEVMKAELSQGDTYTKRARPTVVYAGLAFIALVHVIFPIVAFFTEKKMPTLALPSEFWYTWGGVCSVWIVGRSGERVVSGNKIIKAITGKK